MVQTYIRKSLQTTASGGNTGGHTVCSVSSPLLEHVGLMGEKPAVKQILNGTFDFPPGTDRWTIAIMKEACTVFQHMSPEGICELVEREDFQEYWSKAKEKTSSSKSGLHFGIYMANSRSDKLSLLHAAKLNLAARFGITLDRWHNALTCLLKKTFGSILITKLRAICLLEADYNWLMKLIFAKRMMENARAKGIIPQEQFAKAGSRAQDGCMVKNFHFDRARVLHHTAAVAGVDFHQCYDSVAHPLLAVALQAWGVSLVMVKVMLSVLQTMRFFIRSGFGDSTRSYGGTTDDPLGGLGQGNGAAPPGFTAVSTLLIMAFINMGHSDQVETAVSGFLFTIAAILYVDDTNLLLWAKSRGMDDESFFDQVQAATTDWALLSIASGGSLKPEKCCWYLISFHFRNGKALYKPLCDLPSRQLTIPMRDGSRKPIELKDSSETTLTLGIPQNPQGLPKDHLNKMKQAGLDWADRAATHPLPRYISRMSHDHQLVPKMRYMASSVFLPPLHNCLRKCGKSCIDAFPTSA